MQGLERYLSPAELEKLAAARVGIAGLGGLGSNVAMLLVRSGIQDFVLVDDDSVDASNLNRQHYFPKHVGMSKVDALAQILLELNPQLKLEKHKLHLNIHTLQPLLRQNMLWVEALDDALSKRIFVEESIKKEIFTVSASGIAGYGGSNMHSRKLGKHLVVVGDFKSDVHFMPPLAPRVMQAAAMQADAVLTYILTAC